MTKFSVAMSVYSKDNPVYFDRALESITKNQTIMPNEIIIVFDGPIGVDLENVAIKYCTLFDFIRIVKFEKNKGLGEALKIAIQESKYDLIARMDSDDVAYPTRFQKQIAYMKSNPSVDLCGGTISEFIDKEENIVGYRVVPENSRDIQKYIKKRCPFNHMTVMYKKHAVLDAGNYIDFPWNEDYYLWIRMFENKCVMHNIQEPLVNVRVGEEMYARRGGINYYRSERDIQKYMLSKRIINIFQYCYNILLRFILQVILTNRMRSFVYKFFARK